MKIVFYDKLNVDHVLFMSMFINIENLTLVNIKNFIEINQIESGEYDFIFLEYLPKKEWFDNLVSNQIIVNSIKVYTKQLFEINTSNNTINNIYDNVFLNYNDKLIEYIYCGKTLCSFYENIIIENTSRTDINNINYVLDIFLFSRNDIYNISKIDYFLNMLIKNLYYTDLKLIGKLNTLIGSIYFTSNYLNNKVNDKLFQIEECIDYLLIEKSLLNENIDNTIDVIFNDREMFFNENSSNFYKIIKFNTTDINEILIMINFLIIHFKYSNPDLKIDCYEIHNLKTKQSVFIPINEIIKLNNYLDFVNFYSDSLGQTIKELLITYHKFYNSNENIQIIDNDYVNPFLTIHNSTKHNYYTNPITNLINFNFYKNN